MSRASRIALNALGVVSALLSMATMTLWVRSYRHTDLIVGGKQHVLRVLSGRGTVVVEWLQVIHRTADDSSANIHWTESHVALPNSEIGRIMYRQRSYRHFVGGFLGASYNEKNAQTFAAKTRTRRPQRLSLPNSVPVAITLSASYVGDIIWEDQMIGRALWVPLWILCLLTILPAVLIAAGFLFRLQLRRRCERLGICHSCGYDLRGSGDCCPECGTVRRQAEDN